MRLLWDLSIQNCSNCINILPINSEKKFPRKFNNNWNALFFYSLKHYRAAAAALAAQTGTGRSSRRIVPPLLRSKTLPAIITPASVVCKVAKKGLLIGKYFMHLTEFIFASQSVFQNPICYLSITNKCVQCTLYTFPSVQKVTKQWFFIGFK